jgi:hypothetical protein
MRAHMTQSLWRAWIHRWRRASHAFTGGSKLLGKSISLCSPENPRCRTHKSTIIHADLSKDDFERHWRRVPLYLRLHLYVGASIYALYYRWFGSRRSLAKGHTLDDLPSRDEALRWTPEYVALNEAILVTRDKRLVEVMCDYLEAAPVEQRRLAIVYGAMHMRAVIKELTRRGFHCVDSAWMLIFPLEQGST